MRNSTEYAIIHCSATPPSMDIGRAEIDRWHRQRGWLMIGYHFVIRRDGTIERGRPEQDAGAHAKGYNDKSIGICMVGGVSDDDGSPENNFTGLQFAALKIVVNNLVTSYPDIKVIGHNEISHKACPSFNVKQWFGRVSIRPYEVCPTCGHKS